MKFSYNWLKEYLPKLPAVQKLAEDLTLKSFEVEKIEKVNSDIVMDINLPPNRFSDSSGHLGLAKEISAILDIPLKTPTFHLNENGKLKASNFLQIKVQNKNDCLRYSSRVIFDVKVKESPDWLKKRLESCGLQPINNIVDATNYVMLLTGQPLHAFDYDKLMGKKIKTLIIRRGLSKEKIITLDNKEVELNENILVIADLKNPLAIAGIKGGKMAEIDSNTKRIVLESANFDHALIRRASQITKIVTDASLRFERTLSPSLTIDALNYVAALIQKLADGKILKGIIDVFPTKISKKVLGFNFEQFYQFAGFSIDKKFIEKAFKRLGFKIVKQTAKDLFLEIPPQRIDIERFEDLTEEVLRLYDYNKAPAAAPRTLILPAPANEDIIFRNKIKNILIGLGVDEIYTYSFVSKKDLENFKIAEKNAISLENPISSDYTHLQPTLLINLTKATSSNLRFYDEVRIFEISKTFQKAPIRPYEEWRLAIALADKTQPDDLLFFELKGIIEQLTEGLNCAEVKFIDIDVNWLTKNRAAKIIINEEEIGYIGQLNPRLSHLYNNEFPMEVAELDVEKLYRLSKEEYEFTPLPKYPAVIRDISILVNRNIKMSDILNIIHQSEPDILFDVDLFDIYEGENLPKNKKSLSFHLIFQAEDHTLTNEEVGKSMEKIISNLKAKFNAEIR
ncbi:MAG: phenylalanine--tRNA ligase subunit beta [Candidatus Pacebacteria bacterium]|nr:phenylalanine--tRNA ligase subunit beta [Candidatus Paceibacterota bacterium]